MRCRLATLAHAKRAEPKCHCCGITQTTALKHLKEKLARQAKMSKPVYRFGGAGFGAAAVGASASLAASFIGGSASPKVKKEEKHQVKVKEEKQNPADIGGSASPRVKKEEKHPVKVKEEKHKPADGKEEKVKEEKKEPAAAEGPRRGGKDEKVDAKRSDSKPVVFVSLPGCQVCTVFTLTSCYRARSDWRALIVLDLPAQKLQGVLFAAVLAVCSH